MNTSSKPPRRSGGAHDGQEKACKKAHKSNAHIEAFADNKEYRWEAITSLVQTLHGKHRLGKNGSRDNRPTNTSIKWAVVAAIAVKLLLPAFSSIHESSPDGYLGVSIHVDAGIGPKSGQPPLTPASQKSKDHEGAAVNRAYRNKERRRK